MAIAFIISYSWLLFLAASTLVLVFFWKDYYFFYNRRLLFVVGVTFSRSLTNYAIISVIIWYFTDYGNDLVMSAIFSNIQGSLSSLLVIFMARAADSYVGRFHTLLFSNTAYIGGLMLLWLFNPYDVKWLLVISLVLLALGTSGTNLLQDVLEKLVNDIDKSQDKTETRSRARAAIWSRISYVCGAISAILWVAPDAIGGVHPSWRRSFLICICTMTIALMIFCIGHKLYHQGELTERPHQVFLRVFHVGIKNLLERNSRCSTKSLRHHSSPQKLEIETTKERLPRRQDNDKEKEARGSWSSHKDDMVIVKSLSRMFPMWGMFFVVALISATGSTFYLQQYNNLDSKIKAAIQIYNVIQDLSSFATPFLYRWICGSHKNEKVKIGVGMLCGIVSCIFAWQLEIHRLKEVNHLVDKDVNSTSISFLWLVPQFCLLGSMEGLTKEGLLKLYMSQMKEEPLKSYGEEYIELVMGLGTLLNIFLILILQSLGWFGNTINDSRLDKYYLVLVCLCAANFITYCCIARFCYKDSGQRQNLANDDLNQDNHTEPQTGLKIAG